MPTETLVMVEGGQWPLNFVAGFVIQDGKVVEAAPYLRKRLMGRTTDEAREIISAKGWKATVVRGVAITRTMSNGGSGGAPGPSGGSANSSTDSFNGLYGSGGGGGSASWVTPEPFPDQFELECMLLPTNSGMGGGGTPWTCLGIIPQISPTKNLWVHRK